MTSQLVVYYQVGGSATLYTDYVRSIEPAPGQTYLAIYSGDSYTDLSVRPVDDSVPEGDETIEFTLSSSAEYTVGSPSSATVTIEDDEAPPPTPTATAATNVTSSSFRANWNSVSGAIGYRLDVSTNSSFTSFVVGYNNRDVGNVTSFPVSGLSANTPYYYRVRAYNSHGPSPDSNTIPVTTGPGGDRFEPNDTWQTATDLGTIGSSETISDISITPSGDIDWFEFTLLSNAMVGDKIEVLFTHSQGDIDVGLYSDPAGSPIMTGTSSTDNEVFSISGLTAGTYYLKVYGYAGATNTYSLRFTIGGGAPDDLVWMSQYFPLAVGNSWTYGGAGTFSIYVDSIVSIDGMDALKVYREDQNGYIYFRADSEGLRRLREDAPDLDVYGIFDPPLHELPANAFIGNSYSHSSTEKVYQGGTFVGEAAVQFETDVLGFENVTLSTPANINGVSYSSFQNCLKLGHRISVDAQLVLEETAWYAKDLGIVKVVGAGGTAELRNATTYYTSVGGNWSHEIYGSDGLKKGDIDIYLSQYGSDLTGDVNVTLLSGPQYVLPLQSGYVSGKTANGTATNGTQTFEFALTRNENGLSGPYNSNFTDYGTVKPAAEEPGNGGGGGGGGGCATSRNGEADLVTMLWLPMLVGLLLVLKRWSRKARMAGDAQHLRSFRGKSS